MDLLKRTPVMIVLIAAVALAARLVTLPAVTEEKLTPDGARFLSLARSIERGEGYVSPEAWPAWLLPDSLPAPETFKEPGYAYSIALLNPVTGDPFRSGQLVSLLAGLAIPFIVFALMRRLEPDRPAAAPLAGVFAAASPLLVLQSVYVMADSLFVFLLSMAFLSAMWGRGGGTDRRRVIYALLCGAFAGLAFLVRAQAVMAVPALLWLLIAWSGPTARMKRAGAALAGAVIVCLPFLIRNLLVFGALLRSDVYVNLFFPYVDRISFIHSLEHPPSTTGWALAHMREIAAHTASGAKTVAVHILPGFFLGQKVWLLPFAAGLVFAVRHFRRYGFVLLFGAVTLAAVLPLSWMPRYFTMLVPFISGLAALGLTVIARPIGRLGRPLRAVSIVVVVVACAALFAHQADRTRRGASQSFTPGLKAAREYGPWLAERLEPGEAVMTLTTSYWSWYSDRPSVSIPIAGEKEFDEVTARYRVRYAALPTSRLEEYEKRYPGGEFPAAMEPVLEDAELDVTIFRVGRTGR